jgi:preprotein translocase subunit SecE
MSQTVSPARSSASPRPNSGGRNPFARIAVFVRQIVAELRKVIWPTRSELVTYTVVSVTFVVFMVAFVALLDYVFTKGMIGLFG